MWPREAYKEEYYYTLNEFQSLLEDEGREPYFGAISLTTLISELRIGRLAPYFLYSDLSTIIDWSNTNLEKMWQLLFNRFSDEYAFILSSEISSLDDASEDDIQIIAEWLKNLFNIMIFTFDKYNTLLSLYSVNKSNLLKKIESSRSSISKFSETPQEGGEYGDPYTTNKTSGEETIGTDRDTLIERLEAIENKFSNVLYKWTEEFHKIFMEGGKD